MNPDPVLVALRMGFTCSITQDDVPYARPNAVRYGREPETQPPTLDECVRWLTRSRSGYYRVVTVKWHHMPPVEAELWELLEEHRDNPFEADLLAHASGPTPLDAIYQLVLKAPE